MPQLRASATPANSISRRIRRNSGNCRHQLGAAGPSYNSLGGKPPGNRISGRNLPASRYPALPTQHPTHPSAQPARAGVRSESPNPAERTNKKTAGSHGTGGLDDRPHLLRRQVSSPAPLPSPGTSPREHSRPHLLACTTSPQQHISPFLHHFLNRHTAKGVRFSLGTSTPATAATPNAPPLSFAPSTLGARFGPKRSPRSQLLLPATCAPTSGASPSSHRHLVRPCPQALRRASALHCPPAPLTRFAGNAAMAAIAANLPRSVAHRPLRIALTVRSSHAGTHKLSQHNTARRHA